MKYFLCCYSSTQKKTQGKTRWQLLTNKNKDGDTKETQGGQLEMSEKTKNDIK